MGLSVVILWFLSSFALMVTGKYIGVEPPNWDVEDFGKNCTSEMLKVLSQIPPRLIFMDEILSAELPLKSIQNSEFSLDCVKDIRKIWIDLSENGTKEYAERYVDAAFKIPSGVLLGKWMWPGDYQECIDIEPVFNPATNHTFAGKHFMVAVYLNGKPVIPELGLPAILGICLPSSCDKNSVKTLGQFALSRLPMIDLTIVKVFTEENIPVDAGTVVAVVILSIFCLLVFCGTAVDLWGKHKGNTGSVQMLLRENLTSTTAEMTETTRLLPRGSLNDSHQEEYQSIRQTMLKVAKSFSFIANSERLFSNSTAVGPLACLNGLRVLSMCWVIQAHTYAFSRFSVNNILHAAKFLQRFDFQPIANGSFAVDSFFFLSGLLVAYFGLKEIREKGKLNWIYFFCHRFWRLTPLYAIVIMIFTKLFPHLIHGPFQFAVTDENDFFEGEYKACEKYWWTNLLYINNFYPNYGELNGMCMPWGWYLANDMQFFIFLSPIFIFLTYKHKKLGYLFAIFLIISCVAVRGMFVAHYGQKATQNKDNFGLARPSYVLPYTRMSVYVVGLLTGSILVISHCRIRLNRVMALLGWITAASVAVAVVYGQYYYYSHPETKMSLVAEGFYTSLSRFAWSVSLSWLVLACTSGYGGPINFILAFKLWAPLGRLTYAVYLIHPIIIYFYYINLQEPFHFSDNTMIYTYLGNLLLSYGTAYLVSMAIEAPLMKMENIIK